MKEISIPSGKGRALGMTRKSTPKSLSASSSRSRPSKGASRQTVPRSRPDLIVRPRLPAPSCDVKISSISRAISSGRPVSSSARGWTARTPTTGRPMPTSLAMAWIGRRAKGDASLFRSLNWLTGPKHPRREYRPGPPEDEAWKKRHSFPDPPLHRTRDHTRPEITRKKVQKKNGPAGFLLQVHRCNATSDETTTSCSTSGTRPGAGCARSCRPLPTSGRRASELLPIGLGRE